MADIFHIKKNDLQPYYRVKVVDSEGNAVSLSGASVLCTMKDTGAGTLKIDRQSGGVAVTDEGAGEFEYRWQAGDTDTAGRFLIEFEVVPLSGGKFTVPQKEPAVVIVRDSLDNQ